MTTRKVLAGLVVAHVLWAASFVIGALVLRVLQGAEQDESSGPERSIDFVTATALGLAVITLGSFVLGSVGLLNPIACVVTWVLILATLVAALRLRGTPVAGVYDAILQPLSIVRSRAALAIYALAAVGSIPATLPPAAWDPTMYHLANAVDWAHAGRIVVDPFLRWPYDAFNVELLYALAFVFHLGRFVFFVDWLPFVCSALGVYALTAWLLSRYVLTGLSAQRYCNVLGFAAGLAFLASPLVLSYAVNGYIDVTVGFYLLAATMALIRSPGRFQPYGLAAAAIAGTFVGTKLQFVLFVPLIAGALLYAGRVSHAGRNLAAAFLLFAVFAAPWYAHNLVSTGDPISPVLNVSLGRTDPIYDKADYDMIRAVLRVGAQTIFDAPADFLLNRTPPQFLFDPGTSTGIALVGVTPLIALTLLLYRKRRRVAPELLLLSIVVAYAVLAIMAVTIVIGRYSLTYFPIFLTELVVFGTALIRLVLLRRGISNLAAATLGALVLIALIALPEPMTALAYGSYTTDFSDVRLAAKYPERYLAFAGEGDVEASDLARLLASSHVAGNALDVRYENAAYYFRVAGVTSVGDWFGPGRYQDLYDAIRHGSVPEYFRKFHIDGVLIGSRSPGWPAADLTDLQQAIARMGFVDVTMRGDPVREYVRADVARYADAALLSAVPRAGGVTVSSVQLVDAFPLGAISSVKKAATPTGRGVLLFTWLQNGVPVPAITVVSGYSYRFAGLGFHRDSTLSVDVGKPFPQGKAAVAWVDLTSNGKRRRIVSVLCEPGSSSNIAWHHVVIPLGSGDVAGSITFGASSVAGGGTADWVAYANPQVTDAALAPR